MFCFAWFNWNLLVLSFCNSFLLFIIGFLKNTEIIVKSKIKTLFLYFRKKNNNKKVDFKCQNLQFQLSSWRPILKIAKHERFVVLCSFFYYFVLFLNISQLFCLFLFSWPLILSPWMVSWKIKSKKVMLGVKKDKESYAEWQCSIIGI